MSYSTYNQVAKFMHWRIFLLLWLLLPAIFNQGCTSDNKRSIEEAKTLKTLSVKIQKSLDIVPMPKSITFTGKSLSLSPSSVCIVLGGKASRQAVIGAEWINKQIVRLGGKQLPVYLGETGHEKIKLCIGNIDDNPWIAEAREKGFVDIGKANPVERGYEIVPMPDDRKIYLAGSDPLGVFYACVTFAELIEKEQESIMFPVAKIRDWPDTIYVSTDWGCISPVLAPELAQLMEKLLCGKKLSSLEQNKFLQRLQEYYDSMARRKITLVEYGNTPKIRESRFFTNQENVELLRKGIAYGKERGVGAALFALYPYVGKRQDYPVLWDAMPEAMKTYETDWVRSWSMDDARRETAKRVAQRYVSLGFSLVAFHDADTGGNDNPTQWNDRSHEDRKRWGNNFASAVAHKIGIYYDELKKADPNIMVALCQYPYTLDVLDPKMEKKGYLCRRYGNKVDVVVNNWREKNIDFWHKINKKTPKGLILSMRETQEALSDAFRNIMSRHNILIWFAVHGSVIRNAFWGAGPAWTGSFCKRQGDVVLPRVSDLTLAPFNIFAVREYSWNKQAPGATPAMNPVPVNSPLFSEVYPRITRNLFGRKAAPYLIAAFSPKYQVGQPKWNVMVNPLDIFTKEDVSIVDSRVVSRCVSSRLMNRQAELSKDGADSLDKLWRQCQKEKDRAGMDPVAYRNFVSLRECLHACYWMASVKTSLLAVKECKKKNDISGALEAARKGVRLIDTAKAGLAKLASERPNDPILNQNDKKTYSGRLWRIFMADNPSFNPSLKKLKREIAELSNQKTKNIAQRKDAPRPVSLPKGFVPKVEVSLERSEQAQLTQTDGIVSCVIIHGVRVKANLDLHNIHVKVIPYSSLFNGEEQTLFASRSPGRDFAEYFSEPVRVPFDKITPETEIEVIVKSKEGIFKKRFKFQQKIKGIRTRKTKS